MTGQDDSGSPAAASASRRALQGLFHSRLGGLAVFGALVLGISLLLRVALCLKSAEFLGGHWPAVAAAFGVGLFYDLVTLFYVAAPMALVLLLLPDRLFRWKPSRWVFIGIFGILVFLLLFDAACEWFFWDEFDSRFNFIAVDYLVYPTEVVANILESYAFWPIVSVLGLAAVGATAACYRYLAPTLLPGTTFGKRLVPALVFLLPPVLAFFAVTSSFANIGSNRYVNELAKNGLYSFAEAFFQPVLDFETFYVSRSQPEMLARLRRTLQGPDARFLRSTGQTTLTRRIDRPGPPQRHNVVVVLVESLSAEFLSYAGGKDLTPELDHLADNGLLFTRAYATGTRTVRGMEAVVLSLPPTPGQSVVKRLRQKPLFSLTGLFKEHGYDVAFLYGGYGYFDNMNGFMSAHGCRIVDRADIRKTTFANAWGLCDQDLYSQALSEAGRKYKKGPFFQFILTTSNHRPFTFPVVERAGGVEIRPNGKREPAVQYTDYAIGEFIRKASKEPWFDNTIFVIVADHCHNCRGKSEVPVDRFRIPILLYAPKLIQPRRFDGVCSQIDLAPTLLGLMNFSYVSRFFGVDALAAPPNRALMGTDQAIGLFKDSILTIIRPVKRQVIYRVNDDDTQDPIPVREDLLQDALSYFQSAAHLVTSGGQAPCDTHLPTTDPAK